MAAVSSMIPGWVRYGDLPPTGNRVIITGAGRREPPRFPGYQSHWLQSGTAALALAMLIARRRRSDVNLPSVILPAYGCPDLVAAAEYAGVRAILVDIGADDPGYQLDQLERALDDTCVAVVAVNFLGIRERLAQIRALLKARPGVALIEDNAQWFPERARPTTEPELCGDLVCLSFGRGKPVSLLGGGALLVRNELQHDISTLIAASQPEGTSLRVKAQLFNLLLHPGLYWLVNRNPMIELGQTLFKPLQQIRALDELRLRSLSSAVATYLQHSRVIEQAWAHAFENLMPTKNIAVTGDRRGRLLRYPILCRDIGERDRIWRALDRAGLGVTALYRRALPEISGVDGRALVYGDYAGARAFAERLLTLPVHEGVRREDAARGAKIIAELNRMD